LLICQVRPEKRAVIPAVVHEDGTARLQTVSQKSSPGFYAIIAEFEKLTGVPVIMNTSYNVNGEAIVETPLDAVEAFLFMDIDYLAIGDYLISKAANASKRLEMPIHDFLGIRKARYRDAYRGHETYFDPTEFPMSGETAELNDRVKVYRQAADERLALIQRLDAEGKAKDHQIGLLSRGPMSKGKGILKKVFSSLGK
jgi:hypothetical protein